MPKKSAYPSGYYFEYVQPQHDVKKWMRTMHDIYSVIESYGMDFNEAFKRGTMNWDKQEILDFNDWLKFYQENAHMKYKTAQFGSHYLHEGGSVIPMNQLQANLPQATNMPDMTNFKHLEESNIEAEKVAKEEEVKKKIKAIVSRLNAAERLATIPEVQKALHKVLDIGVHKWLEELQRVKRYVQTAPIKSADSPILTDLIYRRGNALHADGFPKAGKLMKRIAQTIGAPAPAGPPAMPGPPLPEGSDMPEDPNMSGEEPEDAWAKDFIDALNFDKEEDEKEEDKKKTHAIFDDMAAIVVEAQELEPEEPDINVEEEEPEKEKKHFDNMLADVTIEDVIERLEAVSGILKNREIPRQLSIIDLMLHRLNIGSFFPSLAEANRSALESNQYMATRIDDVLSKLKGSVAAPEIHLAPDEKEITDSAVQDLKNKLTEKDRADRERQEAKRRRKEEAIPIETEEGLAGPVEVENPTAPPMPPGPIV